IRIAWSSDRKPTRSCRLLAEPINRPCHHHIELALCGAPLNEAIRPPKLEDLVCSYSPLLPLRMPPRDGSVSGRGRPRGARPASWAVDPVSSKRFEPQSSFVRVTLPPRTSL